MVRYECVLQIYDKSDGYAYERAILICLRGIHSTWQCLVYQEIAPEKIARPLMTGEVLCMRARLVIHSVAH